MKTADLSDCAKYRYRLTRGACLNPLVFIMLNPSTADSDIDDSTIKKCVEIAKYNGHDGIVVANLYALRSTNPENLWLSEDPIGPNNDSYISNISAKYNNVVCAWGNNVEAQRVEEVVSILTDNNVSLKCLIKNKNGMPRHPLYVSFNQKLIDWNM